MNYEFSHENNEVIRNAWNDAKDREVVAVLEMGCADIELMIEREPDNSVTLSLFCCLNFEGTGWESDDYADVGVQDKVSKFTSWEQVEQYMKEELIKYCEKNNVDYTKDALDEKYAKFMVDNRFTANHCEPITEYIESSVSKCETCIHNEVCELNKNKSKVAECEHYKDKDMMFEMPCKVGDTYYAIERFCSYGGVCKDEKVSVKVGACRNCRQSNAHYLSRYGCDKEFRVVEHHFGSVFDIVNKTPLIGKFYFWTVEEAEAMMNREGYEKDYAFWWND